MSPRMDDPAVTLNRATVLAMADSPHNSTLLRVVLYAAERGDATGLATFDPGELSDLLGVPNNATDGTVSAAVSVGMLALGSTSKRLRVHTRWIQPHPVPVVGARYGDLVLSERRGEDRWAVKCARCRRYATYTEAHLTHGLATHTCPTRRRAAA